MAAELSVGLFRAAELLRATSSSRLSLRRCYQPWPTGHFYRLTTPSVRSRVTYPRSRIERFRARALAGVTSGLAAESERSPPAVGIDLGTTSSVVAVVLDGKPVVLADELGRKTMPSVVSLPPNGEELVGWEATVPGNSLPDNTFHSVKRVIGRPYTDISDLCSVLPFTVQPGPDGCAVLHHSRPCAEGATDASKTITPEEVSALVLHPLLQRAEAACGSPIEAAVITIPAHFGPGQMEATIRAGKLAGLKHVELLQEPVAAAMASGLGMDHSDAHTVLVFDLGGGTFDISILDCFEGIMEVLATGGDSLLGGDNWDEAMLRWVSQTIASGSAAAAFMDTPALRHQLRIASRNAKAGALYREHLAFCFLLQNYRTRNTAKERLSTVTETIIELPDHFRSDIAPVTRQQFQDITQPLLERLWTPMAAVAADVMLEWAGKPSWVGDEVLKTSAELLGSRSQGDLMDAVPDKYAPPPRRVTHVVLAGAATRMQAVLQLVETATGITPSLEVDPEDAVALGAAVHAGLLTGSLQGGVEMMDGGYVADQHGRATGLGTAQ